MKWGKIGEDRWVCLAYVNLTEVSGNSGSGATIEGIGFAIPIDDVKDMLDDLTNYGYIRSAYLGISVSDMDAAAAEYLGIPNVSNVLSVEDVKYGKIYVTANLDDKVVSQSVSMPCLISVDGDINTPRLPSYKIKKTLTEDSVKFLTFADFEDQNPDNYGLSGSATQVERIFPPEKNTEKHVISGDAIEQTEGLFGLIKDCKLI